MPLDKEDKALLENACDSQKDKSYQQVYPEELLAKVAAQCSLQPGLANVFGELLVQVRRQRVINN
jgi:Rod binding domain-containing protein